MHIPSVFNTEYFISQLEDSGALEKNTPNNIDQKTLVKVKSLTVGLVLAAKAVDAFSNSDIVKWIRKDRKLTSLLTEQLLKYNELAYYLMNEIEEVDVNTWKTILSTTLYIWPSSQNGKDWANIFGDKVPEICKKIDNDLKNKVKSTLNNSANSIDRVSQEDSITKEDTRIEISEGVKLKSENEMKNQVIDHVETSSNIKSIINENCLKVSEEKIKQDSNTPCLVEGYQSAEAKLIENESDNEKKEQIRDDDEAISSKINLINENFLKESEGEIKKESDGSSIDEDADQLDFLFNDDEELDYEYEAVNTHDITNSHDIEESKENDVLKESENNVNEMKSNSKFDNEPAKSSEDYPQNTENHSENHSENHAENDDEDDFYESNFDDLVVVDAEGDSDENEWDAADDEEREECSREWRFKGRSSNDKDKSKSFSKSKESKNTIMDKNREGSKSEKVKQPDRFEKIVMIADKLYKDYVSSLNSKNDKIVLIADDELTIKSLPDILDRNKHKGEKNSLWIIITGMYSLIKIKDIKRLSKNYIPHVDNTEVKKFSVSALIKEGREMRRIIANCLSESCAVVSCPPIPAVLLVNQKSPMKELSYDLGRFTKDWTRMAWECFEQQRLEYNYRLFRNYLDMHNVGGIHQIRDVRDDSIKKTDPWKMIHSWYEIIESIMRVKVIREKESSQSISSKSEILISASRKRDEKTTSRLKSASEEKSNSQTTTKEQDNFSEKEIHKEMDSVKEVNESSVSLDDKLILRETIEPSNDLLVVVIGEENAAREFSKIKIPKIRFKIVIVSRFDYRDINYKIPGNHLKSENTLWIVLCDLSRLYENKISFCNKFHFDKKCKEEIKFACHLQSHDLSRKCRKISDFADEIREKLGKNSYVFLAPVIPQSVLHCQPDYKTSYRFHSLVHLRKYGKSMPIFQPFEDEGNMTKNYNLFEKEWLKAIENIMRKQDLNFEMIRDFEKKKGKVVEVLREPLKRKCRTKSYKEWENFMEALIITFRISLCNDDSLIKENANIKSRSINEVQIMDNENEIEAERQIDKESCDSDNDIVANQISIENIPNDLKTEDFEKILGMCGKFSDAKYKKNEKLFLFREALVTFMNANSVLHAIRLLNGKSVLNGKLSVKEINKDKSIDENCDEIDLILMKYDEEFAKKAEESINNILTNLGISIVKEPSEDSKEKSENRHYDSEGERQHGKLQDSNKGKENENSKSSCASASNLKRNKEEIIESKEGDRSKSSKSIKDSQSLERKKKSSKDSEEKHRIKSSETLKRVRSMENRKSRSCSPIRKKSRTDDKLKDNEIQFTNIDNNNREIVRLMTHFLAQFGGSRIRLRKSDERVIFRLKNKNVAKLLSTLLCNLRFPDKHLQVLASEDSISEVDAADLKFIAMHLDLVLKRIPHFAHYLDEAHSLWPGAFNLFTFKTKKCLKTHPIDQRKLCVNFHGFTDSRRDPREYDYDAETCPESWNSKDAKKQFCPNGKECRFSHTMLERVFHMSTLKKNVCMDWYQTQSCNANRNCAAAHPETPEVLFHDVWRDVYLSGLEKTYQYLVGAVQNLRHVLLTSQYGCGMQVLVVSPSVYEVEWLATAIKKLAEDHKLRVATATDQDWETGGCDIVVATPGGAVKLLYSQNDVSMSLKGLIIDDIGQLLNTHKLQLASIAQTLINQRGKEDIQLNRVVVSETIYQDEVDNMANILQTEFTVLGTAVNGSPPQMPVDKETDFHQIVLSGKTLCTDDLGVRNKMLELGFSIPEGHRKTSPDTRIDVRTDERSGHKRQQHRESPSGSRQRVRSPLERWRCESSGHRVAARSPGARCSRSPGNNRTRSPSPRDNRKYRGDYGRSERSRDDRYSSERGGLQRDSKSSSRPRDSQFKSFSPRSSRNWSPDNQKLHSGNSIYENLPHGGPPDYNNVSRNGGVGFGQDNIGGGGLNIPVGGTSSSEPAASSPWRSGPTDCSHATDNWRGAAASAEVTACERSTSSTTTFHKHNMGFTNSNRYHLRFYDTCSMLTTICDDLGIIGISFKTTLQRAMQYKSNINKMLETFREPEVKSLMEVVVRKIKELEDISSGIERGRCKVYLHQMTNLIELTKAKDLSQPLEASAKKNLYGLDIESIAKVTLGKDNPFVISEIQNCLLAAQGRVDSGQFSEIFKAVSMLQFDMMIKTPSSGGIISTQTVTDKKESPDRNPSLFNQDISFIANRWEQDRQGYSESNGASGNEWSGKRLGGYVESNRNSRGNIQQHSGISMNRGRMDKYDPMEAGIDDDDYRKDNDCSWNEKRDTRNERVSPLGTQGTNNSSLDVWNQGLKGMEQILGSSLMKGESSLQNSADFSAVNMQNKPSLQVLNREPLRNSDLVGISGFDMWEQQGHRLGSASTNLEVRQGGHNMGPAKWEHQQGHDRGSTGTLRQPPTQYGSTMDDRRQPTNLNKPENLQSFTGPDMWSNPVGKNIMDRNVVDYGHQGSTLSDRKVLDYGHQKEASVNSTFENLGHSENAMDSRYRPGPGSQKSLSSAMSNNIPFLTSHSAPRGSQHGTQYDAEEHYSRITPTGKSFEDHMSSHFSNQLEQRFNDPSQPGSRFGNQPSARFDEQPQLGPTFGSMPRHPGPREF